MHTPLNLTCRFEFSPFDECPSQIFTSLFFPRSPYLHIMKHLALSTLAALACVLAFSQAPTVVSVSPDSQSLNTDPNHEIVITFDQAMDAATFTSENFMVFGRWSGPMTGNIIFTGGGTVATFTPDTDFFYGEWITVMLTKFITNTTGDALTNGYQFNYWTKTLQGYMQLTEVEVIDMKLPAETWIQCYGAYAGDIDNDGFSDLVVVNEFIEDIRIMINDGTGHYGDFTIHDLPGSTKPSTNEGADFNHDGEIDLALGSTQGPEVSVLIGNGDGTFDPEVTYNASQGVRGLAVIDYDCDGFTDIATANRIGNEMAFFTNDGTGVFGAPEFMDTGSNQETATMAADFNNDGIMDLAVGSYSGSELMILLNDGAGNFAISTTQSVSSNPWMVACGDVNGDGNCDLVSANAGGSNLSVSLGDGAGGLSFPSYYSTGSFPLAVDLGDLDGDGDLDMVSSNYSGDDFTLYENNGNGQFGSPITYETTGAGSCAIFHDRNNDGVMDMTLIDEISDIVILLENQGVPDPCDGFAPQISLAGNQLVCDDGMSFTWYADDVVVPGATSSTLIPPADGVYHCMAENSEGCILQTNSLNIAACWYGVLGCTDSTADNYDPVATIHDNSCIYTPSNCLGDFDNNQLIDTGDLLTFLTFFGSVCE